MEPEIKCFSRAKGSCLKRGQHFIFAITRKINNTRMLDTLFIDDSIDIMEQYFHYYNHNNWQLYIKNLSSIFDTESKNICFIGSN